MKNRSASGSYYLALPEDIIEEHDGEISSYWKSNGDVALQLSSRARFAGEQVDALRRLQDRLRHEEKPNLPCVDIGLTQPDHASARFVDEKGIQWFYVYFTWPDLSVFATVSGPPEELSDADHWTFKVLRSLQRSKP